MTSPAYTLSVLRSGTEAVDVQLRWFRRLDPGSVAAINRCLAERGVELLHSPVEPGWLLSAAGVRTAAVAGDCGQLELEVCEKARSQRGAR